MSNRPAGFGIYCTVAWTELQAALVADGFDMPRTCGRHTRLWIEGVAEAALEPGGSDIYELAERVGAEIDGGESPDYQACFPGSPPTITFTDWQLERFVLLVAPPAPARDSNQREVEIQCAGRSMVAVIAKYDRGDAVRYIYQLTKHRNSAHPVRRKIWPKNPPGSSARAALEELGADDKGWVSASRHALTKD